MRKLTEFMKEPLDQEAISAQSPLKKLEDIK